MNYILDIVICKYKELYIYCVSICAIVGGGNHKDNSLYMECDKYRHHFKCVYIKSINVIGGNDVFLYMNVI